MVLLASIQMRSFGLVSSHSFDVVHDWQITKIPRRITPDRLFMDRFPLRQFVAMAHIHLGLSRRPDRPQSQAVRGCLLNCFCCSAFTCLASFCFCPLALCQRNYFRDYFAWRAHNRKFGQEQKGVKNMKKTVVVVSMLFLARVAHAQLYVVQFYNDGNPTTSTRFSMPDSYHKDLAARGAASVPTEVLAKTTKSSELGTPCHVWRDTNTTVSVESFPFGSNLITVGPFQAVLAAEGTNGIAFEPAFDFVSELKTDDSNITTSRTFRIQTACIKGPELKATHGKPVAFNVLITGQPGGPRESVGLRGKGKFTVYLVQPVTGDQPMGKRISNSLQIVIDIDRRTIQH